MRKIITFVTVIISIILFYFTINSAVDVFYADWQIPETTADHSIHNRIVLITRELDTPFWEKVSEGAKDQARNEGARLEVWGSYAGNQEDFLKQIDIAIYAKVDGIIVQGLGTDEFKELTKVKAASHGIPIITVANDVPMEESLRKTYVGSDHYLAGELIANQLIKDMGTAGQVIIMKDSKEQYYQKQRLSGIQDVLVNYPNIEFIVAESSESREDGVGTTKDLLNRHPNVNAFIAVNATFASHIVEEISRRTKVENYHIYSFDEDSASCLLLKQGTLDAMVEQSPKRMGERSVSLMMKWLKDGTEPLELDGYHTDIELVKAADVQ
ncbi:substrate-binding domain-containing protein [Alkalihalobacillus sp. MEB130]|uniref:substrate-binding domain-containing protein n=1 Tax=Alkalihalobacillus sp. MEB130 TaxID=2976704 RepID=UPI0028DD68C5|nr:substrate-binding domain-containing protein [Alkalihalobacillus sp. MEB130]MDT8860709.1 substrate-binding domain-containing protein [Alkalihalobacillus sp. MEB130]